jgi:lysine 6-dehydrogenase
MVPEALTYAVVGAGRQGVAAAYDLAKFGEASAITFIDANEQAAHEAASTVNRLIGRAVARAVVADASDLGAMRNVLAGTSAIVGAAHYGLNPGLTRVAIEIGAHMVDLGGHTGIVRRQHAMNAEARAAGVTIVPDTGMGPGLNISMAAYAMSLLDEPREVLVWDGGLPQDPQPPWNYVSTFAVSGLTNEYAGHAYFLRDGEITEVECFSDLEELDFPAPIGRLEAFVTSGGLSTAPWTWKGKLQRLENKTLRYPGHCARFKAYAELGLLDLDPIDAGGVRVVPREVFHVLLEPRIGSGGGAVRDVCVMRVRAIGLRGGKEAAVTVELTDWYDDDTGFTAMQRLTGWHAAIVAGLAAKRRLEAGVVPVENVPGALVVKEGRRRGWRFVTNM